MHNGECGDICMHKSGEIYPLFQFSPLRLRDNQRSPLCPAVCSPWKSFCISVFLSCSELAQRTLQSGAQTVNTIRTEFAISDFHRCGGTSLLPTTSDSQPPLPSLLLWVFLQPHSSKGRELRRCDFNLVSLLAERLHAGILPVSVFIFEVCMQYPCHRI